MLFQIVMLIVLIGSWSGASQAQAAGISPRPAEAIAAKRAILFVLEGFDQSGYAQQSMPALSRLIKEGASTWSADMVSSDRRLPAMASLLTGLPVEKHAVTWEQFEFSRGYPRPPTIFDYLDLSGGLDSAIFFMDEALYQLAKPEPYTDYQLCGALKAECTADRIVSYISQYLEKAASGHGYGHASSALPHLLVVHLPEPARAGQAHGWHSAEYRAALRSTDRAIGSILQLFAHHHLLSRTALFVTSLNGTGGGQPLSTRSNRVPWIASGAGIRGRHPIRRPVSIIDTGASIMAALGLTTHTEWDSRSVEEIFEGRSSLSLVTP